MDLLNEGNGSGDEEMSSSGKGKKQYHRHSTQQIQQLEAFYKECPHPDKNQRQQLSDELGLDHKQIKFWFQNKRTQVKVQNEKADNSALRSENERIHYENLAMEEALKNVICPNCNGSGLREEEKRRNLQRLRMENARLKEEHERTISFFSNYMGSASSSVVPGMESLTNIPPNNVMIGGAAAAEASNPLEAEQAPPPFQMEKPMSPTHWSGTAGIQEREKTVIIETVVSAMEELLELFRINEPVWIKSLTDGRFLLHHDSYDKLFPKPNYFKSASARFESSRDTGEVAMAPIHLVEMLHDANKWKDIFPNLVTKARTLEVLDTGMFGGFLQLMYEKVHILSPLVAPREFFLMRYIRQLNPSSWLMVEISHDFIKEFQDTSAAPTRSWKLPSGCMIEDLSNGRSKVTWIEHSQVDDKLLTHRLYRDLVCGSQAYGAKRWIATLERMCERFAYSMGLNNNENNRHELEGVIDSPEGRRNLMKLSHRMMKDFCEALSMSSDKLEFPHMSEFKNGGVRVSMRRSEEGEGQPEGFVMSAATSIWLPILPDKLFEFFQDDNKRIEWDVLSSGNPISAVAQVSTGTHPGNRISIIQPFIPKENNMLMLQESSIDNLGSMIVYAPIDLTSVIAVVNGGLDTLKVPILPSGYVISSDGRSTTHERGSSTSTTGSSTSCSASSSTGGSLLTVAFQILVCHSTLTKQLNMESVATVHALISSTIQKIKASLNCLD